MATIDDTTAAGAAETGKKILVFGGTGPTGICLLRELMHRRLATVAYARSPNKIPAELASNSLLEIIKGELSDTEAISTAVSKASAVISLLGPNVGSFFQSPANIPTFYRDALLPLMRQHGVRRVFAMGTLSIPQPLDRFSIVRWVMVLSVMVLANKWYRMIRAIERVFAAQEEGVDWTVYRIAAIPGGCDEASWRADREDGDAFEGWLAEDGWCPYQRRAALARWLVDAVEDGKERWIGKMPAVSRLAGSKTKTT